MTGRLVRRRRKMLGRRVGGCSPSRANAAVRARRHLATTWQSETASSSSAFGCFSRSCSTHPPGATQPSFEPSSLAGSPRPSRTRPPPAPGGAERLGAPSRTPATTDARPAVLLARIADGPRPRIEWLRESPGAPGRGPVLGSAPATTASRCDRAMPASPSPTGGRGSASRRRPRNAVCDGRPTRRSGLPRVTGTSRLGWSPVTGMSSRRRRDGARISTGTIMLRNEGTPLSNTSRCVVRPRR